MNPLPDLPELRIVPTDLLQPHEQTDPDRVQPLMAALKREGLLRNPPIVLPLGNEGERYLVLDGANRTTALREMQIPFALVQVVHFGSETVKLRTWNRVILSADPGEVFESLSASLEVSPLPRERRVRLETLAQGERLAYLAFPDGNAWSLGKERERLVARVRQLHQLLDSVAGLGRSERSSEIEAEALLPVYPDLAALLIFPPFTVEEVMDAAITDLCLPAGLTRFIISPRALRINYPLEALSSEGNLAGKQAELDRWVQSRIQERRVRYYAESTFLFDE
jgi:hypothetical protein